MENEQTAKMLSVLFMGPVWTKSLKTELLFSIAQKDNENIGYNVQKFAEV
ncbi:hypothetical protein ACFPA1_11710 [Neobacillus sp. GCM10023253]